MLPLIDIGGIWHIGIFFVCLLSLIQIIKLDAPFNFLYGYVAVYALFILEYPHILFGVYSPNFEATAGQVLVEITLIPLLVIRFGKYIKYIIPCLAAFAACCTWLKIPGLLNAPSFNSAFAAMMLPFVVNPYLFIFIIATALFNHGSTALLIITSQLVAECIKRKVSFKIFVPIGIPVLIYSAYKNTGINFDSGERLRQYSEYFHFWFKSWRWVIFGVGPGSFMWTSVILHKYQTGIFLQMHSDWLQILWEEGLIGFVLSVLCFISAVKKTWQTDNVKVLAALFGFAAFCVTYHPLRFAPTAVISAYIFLKAAQSKRLGP